MGVVTNMQPYGCHNRPTQRLPVPVQDGWFLDGVTRVPRMVPWINPMSTDCKWETRATDPRCIGCKLI